MANRKVSVALELDVARFKAPALEAASTIEKVEGKVDALDRSLNKIPADALKAAVAVKALGEGARGAADHLDSIGAKSAGLSVLDAKIRDSRAEVRKLTEEFIKTGDLDVFERLGKASGNQRGLTDIRKKLAKTLVDGAEDGAKAASGTFSSMLQSGIVGAFQSLPPEAKAAVMAGIGVAALAAVPVIVAAVDAALLTALGAGGLAAGIMLAAKSPVVRDAFSDLSHDIGDRLKLSAVPFRGALTGVAGDLGDSFDKVAPRIDRIFANLAKTVRPLLGQGLGKALENAAPGLEKAFAGAVPLVMDLARWLPKLGEEVGELGEALARAEPEAELFFKFVLANIDVAIGALTFLTKAIDGIFGAMLRWVGIFAPISPALGEVKANAEAAGAAGSTAFTDIGNKASDAATQIKELNTQFNDTRNKILGMSNANIAVAADWDKLAESFKKNGATIDINTEKGRANQTMINETVADLGRQRDAAIAAGGGTKEAYDKANAAYNKQIDNLEALLVSLGLGKKAAHEMMAQFKDKTVTVTVKTVFAQEGTPAEHRLTGNSRLGGNDRGRYGAIRRAASGMIVPPSDPGTFLFGEPQTGGEAFIPLQGIPQSRALDLMQTAGAGYGLQVSRGGMGMGGGAMRFEHTWKVADGSNGTSGLATLIMRMARTGELQMSSRAIVG